MFGPAAQQDPIDGVPLSWTARHPDGVPFRRGDVPDMMTKAQLQAATVKIAGVMSEVLHIPADMERYRQILQWISTGAAVLRFEDRRPYPDDPGKWAVWLCWVELRGAVPAGR